MHHRGDITKGLIIPTLATLALLWACAEAEPASTAGAGQIGQTGTSSDASGSSSGGQSGDQSGGEAAGATNSPELSELGSGYFVWETNRNKAWRLWKKDLRGAARQFVADEPGRQHCCAHISPDGQRVAYLSLQAPANDYADGDVAGELRLVDPEGQPLATIGPARINHENRAAVWVDNSRLIYIDGQGRTVEYDIGSATSTPILDRTEAEHGWLVNATRTAATMGSPSFSSVNGNTLSRATPMPGCQPYFTHDGEWGFWAGGAGGPIYGLRLDTRSRKPILLKDDPRLPHPWRYLYFPMVSRDGAFLTWGASRGGHSHHKVDYEIFVAEIDPDTLELVGPPIRATRHKAVDRYADIYVEPSALGTVRGEAPLRTAWSAPSGSGWQWDFGDGSTAVGNGASHVYARPGLFSIRASNGSETLTGRAVVRPAAPPSLLATSVLDDRHVRLEFDEAVAADSIQVAGGATVDSSEGRTVTLRLSAPLQEFIELTLTGIADTFGNEAAAAMAIELDPALWPIERDSTVAVWSGVEGFNIFRDPTAGTEEALVASRKGLAIPAASGGVRVGGGWLEIDADQSKQLVEVLKGTNEFTVELLVRLQDAASGDLISWGLPVPRNTDLALTLNRGALAAYLRGTPTSRPLVQPQRSGNLAAGLHHLAMVFNPGELVIYVNGREASRHGDFAGDLFHWQPRVLRFGGREGGTTADLAGEINGFALHRRAWTDEMIADASRRALRAYDATPQVWQVTATKIAATPKPSLEEISPYREALVANRYRLENPPTGLPVELAVVEWAILDGKTLADPPATRRLELQRFSDLQALEGLFLANGFEGEELYYSPPRP